MLVQGAEVVAQSWMYLDWMCLHASTDIMIEHKLLHLQSLDSHMTQDYMHDFYTLAPPQAGCHVQSLANICCIANNIVLKAPEPKFCSVFWGCQGFLPQALWTIHIALVAGLNTVAAVQEQSTTLALIYLRQKCS